MSRLGRRVFPSIADFIFAGIVFARPASTLFDDGDTGWHLWAGGWFLQHGVRAIPDPLSFSRVGVLWHSQQWLGELLLSLGWEYAKYLGVAMLCMVTFAGSVVWLYRILLRETNDVPSALLVTLLVARVVLVHLLARPVVFTFPLFLAVWELARRDGRRRMGLFLVFPLSALWANIHPSAFLAPAVFGFAWLAGRHRDQAVATVLSVLAMGATPWGFSWLARIAPTGENLRYLQSIQEWGSPQFRDPAHWGLLALILLALAVRRGAPGLSRWWTVWGIGWLSAALAVCRVAPYAAMAWAPFLGRDLASLGLSMRARGGPVGRIWTGLHEGLSPFETALRPGVWQVVLGATALIIAPVLKPLYPTVAQGFPPSRFPERALDAADCLSVGPRVLNGYMWGGYISWARPARYKTFIDGRAGFFGDRVLSDYLEMVELRPGWAEALKRNRPDWMLLPPSTPLAVAAPLTGTWRIAYRDSTAALLVPVAGTRLPVGP